MTIDGGSWCILRTAGRSTLKLADTLAEDGFEVWTPRETVTYRKAKRNARRTVTQPMLAGYVFARASSRFELLRLSRDIAERGGAGPGRPSHPRFTLWVSGTGVWTIADQQMDGIRTEEQRAKLREALRARRSPKNRVQPFPPGVMVRIKDGSGSLMTGLIGRVTTSTSGNTQVLLSGAKREWTIRTSLLDFDDVGSTGSLDGTPHKMRDDEDRAPVYRDCDDLSHQPRYARVGRR